ncbi:MAG: DegT/DnrJ/EryC1/StrS family aminotransferase, partial [Sphaerospermopsis kisseleviana]
MFTTNNLSELAYFGGEPKFKEKLYVGRPNIGNRERLLARINNMLDRRWLSNNGVFVQEFEQRIAEYLGVKHCIAICNGTIALELVIRALELKGEVIIPSFTFIATAHALQWQEITPVFCDIDPKTHTLNPWRVES